MLGIKGSGMSALAILLSEYGFEVSGCDTLEYVFTQECLDEHNIKYYGDIVEDDYDFVIKGNSYDLKYSFKCPVYRYVDVLRYLSCRYYSIAVCGSHGKTTTTGMLATILKDKCGYLIGDGSGYLKEESKYFVFEACEYKRNFLNYKPNVILINNIDLDHIDYFDSIDDYVSAFLEFSSNAKDVVIVNGDDIHLSGFKDVIKFGFGSDNDIVIRDYIQSNESARFSLCYKGKVYSDIELNLYGKHQVYDAVGAICVGLYLNESVDVIISNLRDYKFNNRRFNESLYGSNIIVDDYGHQPNQLIATYTSLKIKYPDKQIVCIFKPDRYSRLFYFKDEFVRALYMFDEAYICDFPACSKNDLTFPFSATSLVDNKITFFDENDYSVFKDKENTVFLVTSSKYVNNIKEGVKEMIKDG